MNIDEYIRYKEYKKHKKDDFHYNTYPCTIPLDFPRVNLHWHNEMEIIYIKKGSGVINVSLKDYEVSEGDIVPVFPGELHSINAEHMEYENIIFGTGILKSCEENDWSNIHIIKALNERTINIKIPITAKDAYYQTMKICLDTADQATKEMNEGYSLVVKSQLFLFLYELYKNRLEKPERHSTAHIELIRTVLSWIKLHYMEKITVDDAAAITGYSKSYFMKIFKEHSGESFLSYLIDYRLDIARYLLIESDDPVNIVSENCGFDNFSYFIRKFKEKYGLSPLKYRKKYK